MEANISVDRKRYLLSGAAAVLALSGSGTALAQTAAANIQANTIEQVVVTAEKRASTVQRTPATVDVVTATTLQRQNITQVEDLNSVLLNTQIVPEAYVLQITIRGIGSYADPRADPAAALSFNGLFFNRAVPVGFGFLDVSRVETVEGPQGTLYGRNSAAGAVNVITNQPNGKFGGVLQATVGNLGANQFTGVLNLPVTDDLALRVAYDRNRRDGYVSDYFDDIHTDTGRLSARWTPTSKLTIYGEANYEQVGGHGSASVSYPCAGSTPFSVTVPASCAALGTGGTPLKNTRNASFLNADQIHIDYDLGWSTLTSITGYVLTHDAFFGHNATYFDAGLESDNRDYSEELRLAGNDTANHRGGVAWQVGAFFFDSTGDSYAKDSNAAIAPLNGTTIFNALPQHSGAGYAQLSYGITDSLRATVGARYTDDFKGMTISSYNFLGMFTPPATTSYSGSKATYKVGLEYDVAPGHMLYATVATGYVSGGPTGGDSSAPLLPFHVPAIFRPETDTSYEIGSKNRFLDNRLQLNADVYYFDFQNYQYIFPGVAQGQTQAALQIQNAASAKNFGVEVSSVYALTPDDRLTAAVSYSKATFGAIVLDSALPGTNTAIAIPTAAGSPLTSEPTWVGLLGYEHTWALANSDSVVLSVNSKLSSKYLLVIGSADPDDTQKAYTVTDASIAYKFDAEKYALRLWAKNLENAAVNVYGQGQKFHQYGVSPPRTYGITASAKF